MKVRDLDISARARACLINAGYNEIEDLKLVTDEELLSIKIFNQTCLKETREAIARYYSECSAGGGCLDAIESQTQIDDSAARDKGNTQRQPSDEEIRALAKAVSYLKGMPFSYEGLIHQLMFNHFSQEVASYAVENCGADWNEQALKKALSYLKTQAFSRKGLIHQLEYNKVSNEDALYAVDNCNADWNEQALKKATSYLKNMKFTKERLASQLTYNGFIDEQVNMRFQELIFN